MHQSMYGAGSQEFMSNQGVVPNSAVHYSPGTSQPSTPTIGTIMVWGGRVRHIIKS